MTINSRSKGIRGEHEVRDLFRDHGYLAERGQQHAGGTESPDVKHNMPGVHVEVKLTETFNAYKAMEQADRDRKHADIPVVFHRRNRRDWLVVMTAADWFKLQRKALASVATID